MAPNVSLYFYPANDLNGDPLHVITDEDSYFRSLKLKLDLYGLGGAELVLARRVGFAGFGSGTFGTEVFVRVLVHAYSDTEFFTGFFLEKRSQVVVSKDEVGGEEFHFGGPGPKAYLERARLRPETFTDSDWHLDLENGVWRWKITATWTGVMRRLLLEDAASDAPALPDLTYDFDFDDDSNGDPPDEVGGTDEYEIEIGESYIQALWDLEDADFGVSTIGLGTVSSPEFVFHLWNTYGSDVHASSYAPGKALLLEGSNIVNDSLELDGVALRKCTHVIVEGKDGVWVTVAKPSWDPGEYVKFGKISYTRSSKVTVLERVGIRWLRRQDNGDQEITVAFLPGHDDSSGLYFPNDGPLALGNSVSVDTTAEGFHTPLDLSAGELQLVTGFEMDLLEASRRGTDLEADRSWDLKVKLNYERGGNSGSPNQSSAASGGSSCKCIGLCQSAIEPTSPTLLLDLLWDYGTNLNDTTNTYPGADYRQAAAGHTFGSAHGEVQTDYAFTPRSGGGKFGPFTPGQTVRLYGAVAAKLLSTQQTRTHQIYWYAGSGDVNEISRSPIAIAKSGSGAGVQASYDVSVVIPAGAAYFRVRWDRQLYTDDHGLQVIDDDASAGSPGDTPGDVAGSGDPGDGSKAARCDHTHAHGIIHSLPDLADVADELYTGIADRDVLTWDATNEEWVADTGGGAGHTIKEDGTPLTARAGLNFGSGIVASDDAGNNETDVDLDWGEDADVSTQAFGDAAATGTSQEVARAGHKHGMPANPVSTNVKRAGLRFRISGFGSVIATGSVPDCDLEVPFDCTIVGWALIANESGSTVLDVWKDVIGNHPPTLADTITASAKPTLSSVIQNSSSTLTGWTTSLSKGDVIRVNVDSATTVTGVTLTLYVEKT